MTDSLQMIRAEVEDLSQEIQRSGIPVWAEQLSIIAGRIDALLAESEATSE